VKYNQFIVIHLNIKINLVHLLKKEIKHLGREVSVSAFNVDEAKDYQDTKLSFGWVFWPSYFIIDDNEEEAKKLALLKGKYQSLIDIIKFKNCNTNKCNET